MHANMCSEHVKLLLHLLFHHRMLSRSEGVLQVHTWLGSLEYMLLLTTFWYIVFSECKRNVSVNYCRSGFKITSWRERKTVLWRSFFFSNYVLFLTNTLLRPADQGPAEWCFWSCYVLCCYSAKCGLAFSLHKYSKTKSESFLSILENSHHDPVKLLYGLWCFCVCVMC